MKYDRMAAYEATRVSESSRPTVTVELQWRGVKGYGKGSNKHSVSVPRMRPMPDIILCRGHYFVHRRDEYYVEGTMWPVLTELDEA